MNFIIDGGPIFMVPLVVLLVLVLVLFVKGLKSNTEKNADLLKSISLFSLAFGVLGFVLGMLVALDFISMSSQGVSPQILATGVKVAMFSPTFGLMIFIVGRLADIILRWKRN